MNVTGAEGTTPPIDSVVLAGGTTVVVMVVEEGDVGVPEAHPTAKTETPSKRANTTATNERRPDMRHPQEFFEKRSTQRVSF